MTTGKQSFDYFDELRTVSRTNIFQIKSIYGESLIRDITTGTVTQVDGEYVLANAGNGDVTILDSAERGPYQPGYSGEMGAGLRLSGAEFVGDTKVDFGLFGDSDGFFFRFDAKGLSSVVIRGGIEKPAKIIGYWDSTKTKITTIGSNIITIDMLQGHIYQILYSWYAYGPTRYSLQLRGEDPGNENWMKVLDEYTSDSETSVKDPHQPVRIRVTTGVGDPAYTAYVGGRQYSILGQYSPIYRETTIEQTVASVTDAAWVPVMAVRRKAASPYALTRLGELFIRSTSDVRVAIENNGLVPVPNYQDIVDYLPTETLLEADLAPGSALGISPGVLVNKIPYSGGQQGRPGISNKPAERLPLIEQQPFVIYVRLFSGETNADVNVTAVFEEEF